MADNKPGAQTKAAEETREIESDRLRWLVEAQGAAYVQGMEVMADKLANVLAERLADQPRACLSDGIKLLRQLVRCH